MFKRICKCPPNKCANREVPGADVSDASVMSDASNMSTTEETENQSPNSTARLLDATFQKNDFATPVRSPLKSINRNSGADIFANSDSDIEATPTNKLRHPNSFFPSPQLE